MTRWKRGQPMSVRLREAADYADHCGAIRAEAEGRIKKDPPGAPTSVLMRQAAAVVELYEEAEQATFHRPGGLQVVPSAAWWDGQVFRIVPELEEPEHD